MPNPGQSILRFLWLFLAFACIFLSGACFASAVLAPCQNSSMRKGAKTLPWTVLNHCRLRRAHVWWAQGIRKGGGYLAHWHPGLWTNMGESRDIACLNPQIYSGSWTHQKPQSKPRDPRAPSKRKWLIVDSPNCHANKILAIETLNREQNSAILLRWCQGS